MPSYEEDRDRRERRRRDSSTHRKHHHKHERRESRGHGGTSGNEASRSRSRPGLSMDALAQLNERNTRGHVPEPSHARRAERKRRESQPRRSGYDTIEVEYESPHRERARNYAPRDFDSENESPRRTRRPRHEYSEPEREPEPPRRPRRSRGYVRPDFDDDDDDEYGRIERERRRNKKKKRIVSGAIVEEGRSTPVIRGGVGSGQSSYDSIEDEKSRTYRRPAWAKKKRWIAAGIGLVLLIIIIIIAVVVGKKNASNAPNKIGLGSVNPNTVPTGARGSYLDPFTWYDTIDLNVTYTNETVGGLPTIGLFTDWDDSEAANSKVPALNKPWGDYGKKPARGVNLGGWLSLEPFITPSLFDYDIRLGVVDEWTLCKHLGPKTTAITLEKHYATFVTEQTFKEIRDAGLDHVRIPYSYWAVEVYDDDPYLFRISWRYLLRGIEWARKYGLRVNLDLHGLPGSQNGWNHSGRLGAIGWLNGTNGELNAQRSLDVHDRLSKFFAQDRYKNIIAFYGLANEPQMVRLSVTSVIAWIEKALSLIRGNGVEANVVFGDGFMGLEKWQGLLTGHSDLILDVHQYVIFNNDLIKRSHQEKVMYACDGWSEQALTSLNTATGYGPTMFAEWSQADTDCAEHLTNVGWGNRWAGTYDPGASATAALTPMCPAEDSSCSCNSANAPAGDYSGPYKDFLLMFAEAQMTSFEKGYGWWYWTWDTESAPQWSYRQGLAAGILPAKAYDRGFNCDTDIPDFGSMGLAETYRA